MLLSAISLKNIINVVRYKTKGEDTQDDSNLSQQMRMKRLVWCVFVDTI